MTDRKAIVTIEPSGSRPEEYRRAMAAVRAKFGDPKWERPDGWVFHHSGERGVLQLVPEDLHGELPHAGGFAAAPPVQPATARTFTSPLPLRGSPGRLTEAELRRFESLLEVTLPGAYREFLLRANGGRPRVDSFLASDGAEEMVDVFFSLDEVVAMLQRYSERTPMMHIPIARDPFGNLLLLDLESGKVLFWDHEEEEAEGGGVRVVAGDFGELLGAFFAMSSRA